MVLSVRLEVGAEPLPGYQLCQFLGRGSWGVVWKATKPNGNPIALKFLNCESTQAAAQEIRALQRAGVGPVEIARRLGVSRMTVWRKLKEATAQA